VTPLAQWEAAWPIRASQLYVAAFYLWSGLAKLRTSGLEWFAGGKAMQALLLQRAVRFEGQPDGSIGLWFAHYPDVLMALAVGVTAMEIAFPIVLFLHSSRLRVAFLAAVTFFHVVNFVLMDVMFKGATMTGIEATRQIKTSSPSTKVVIMTAHDDDRLMVEAVEAGASGFLSKDLPADEILRATRSAADGEVLIDPVTLTRLLTQVAREREEQRDALALLNDLTDRERQILELLAQGKRNDDIARELFISPQTVQTHVRNILGKLRVHSKLEAVAFAVKHGAIQVS
jgi:DNA-binding NarL/FixJ family response regulator